MQFGGYPYVSPEAYATHQKRKEPESLKQAFIDTILPNRQPNKGSRNLSKAYCLMLAKKEDDCQSD